MRLREAAILYNPGGEIVVTHQGHEDPRYRHLQCSTGGVYTAVHDLSPAKARLWLLEEAIRLMVHQGLAPEKVHEALLGIDEYRLKGDSLQHDLDLNEIDDKDEISGSQQSCLVWCNTHQCHEWHWLERHT